MAGLRNRAAADCLPIRERLTELSLSTLDPDERAFVERHLEWCAGCRKEAAELAAAAALVGEWIPQEEPPAGLEDRVVKAVRSAAGFRPIRRGRLRVAAVAVAAALLVGVIGVGWGVTQVQHANEKAAAAEQEATDFARKLDRLIISILPKRETHVGPQDHLKEAQLAPTGARHGGGSAAVFISPVRDDWALVVIGGLAQSGAPYHVSLRDKFGEFVFVGTLRKLDAGGGGTVWNEYNRHLDGYTDVVVKDRTGQIVLSGTIAPSPVATATP
jgi:hypothetical protein